jgi:hypothetical protein
MILVCPGEYDFAFFSGNIDSLIVRVCRGCECGRLVMVNSHSIVDEQGCLYMVDSECPQAANDPNLSVDEQ